MASVRFRLAWSVLLLAAPAAHAGAELDISFGANGFLSLNHGVTAAVVVPDGTIPWVGYAYGGAQPPVPPAPRGGHLPPNGSGDPLFIYESPGIPAALARHSDGKLVVAGRTSSPSELVITRLLPDGRIDSSFAVFRMPETQPGTDVAVLADGRVLALSGGRLLRLLENGALDPSYGNGGIATLPSEPGFDYSLFNGRPRVRPLADGRAIVSRPAVVQCFPCAARGHLIRLTSAGVPDATFNGSGSQILDRDANDIDVYPDGRIVVGGKDEVIRIAASGGLDPTFGRGGIARTLRPADVRRILLEPDGSITGIAQPAVLMRWRANGSPEGRVAAALTLARYAVFGSPAVLVLQPDGRRVTAANYFLEGDGPIQGFWARFGAGSADPFEDARLFAAHQYRDFLAREGDAAGIAYWAGQIDSGNVTRAQLTAQFFGSPEFQGIVAPIVRLYLACFLRPPDGGGMTFWTSTFREGGSLTGISQQFVTSAEFTQRYGNLDDLEFVRRVYQNVLAREPDSGGLQYWSGRLSAGMTRGEMMTAFSESGEFRAFTAAEVFVSAIYAGALQRAADASGYGYWVGRLDQGASGSELIEAFLGSAEYRNRFLP